jgi:3-oxoacyl-[acyl-carrier protein] reductase
MTMTSLIDKIALVTGASGGIGMKIAETLSSAGATVALCYHSHRAAAEQALAACSRNAFLIKGDVSLPGECRRIASEVTDRAGRIDILVNNAAIGKMDSFSMPYDKWNATWNETLQTNLMSAVNLSYCCVEKMQTTGGGKIINVASRSAFRGETEYMAYAASKAAMINFTRCLARTLATANIKAYAVAPGFIDAGIGREDIARMEEEIRAQIPSGIIGSAQDVANVVLFLASGLSDYITGSTIDVNGGSYLH